MLLATLGKLKFSHILRHFMVPYEVKKARDIWHPKLNSVGHQDRALKTHEPGMNRTPIHKAYIIHVLPYIVVTAVHPQKQ